MNRSGFMNFHKHIELNILLRARDENRLSVLAAGATN